MNAPLRVGIVGCGNVALNFDPSHLLWMGADPVAAIGALDGAIHHVHAKDIGGGIGRRHPATYPHHSPDHPVGTIGMARSPFRG